MGDALATIEHAALTLHVDHDGVAWLVFDDPDSRLNILTRAILTRLDALVGEIETLARDGHAKSLVVRSGKAGSFIAGADVTEIASITDEDEGYRAARAGQELYRRIELLPIPTVAAVDGICLGGATELILACGYRIATDRPQTKIGLPEVRLGILPGWGGTTRLPRLIGLSQALPMILTGQAVSASKAKRIGLVEEVVHPALLVQRAGQVAREGLRPRRRRRSLPTRVIDQTLPGRALALSRAKAGVLKETRGHYPAPLVAVDTIRETLSQPLDEAFEIEARALGRLIVTPVSKNLLHVFNLMESAKKPAVRGVEPHPVQRVAVLGAGVMGGGIAQLLAYNDIGVRLKDIQADALARGLQHARQIFDRAVRRNRMTRREAGQKMDLIAPTLDNTGLGTVDLVIEAVVERMAVKQSVLRDVESRVRDDAIITSNTSSLSITEMQGALERPGNFCGMHFFNPVHRMPLVEVIRGRRTSEQAIVTVHALVRRLDKTPVIVNDGPGFLVNRILSPYLNEAGWLLQEGASVEDIDEALLDFGMPMGPLRLLDEIGLDVARHAGEVMHDAFGDRLRPAPALAALEGTELLGRKSGRGFYTYEGDRQQSVNASVYEVLAPVVPADRIDIDAEVIRARTILLMVNEAARTLEDGIADGPGAVDLAMITGTGFPPFRGGLLRWADSIGVNVVLERLLALAMKVGPRYEPASMIRELAANARGFYG
jgi:3-hydroxyacyl-CoA dehydrogenase/enoyl-CoA hydratase/3-hydroxybutyryl-CoA epimerase